jgi:hypothetical protein
MPVAKGRNQFVIGDRLAALAGRPADWRETSLRPQLPGTEWIVGKREVGRQFRSKSGRRRDKLSANV